MAVKQKELKIAFTSQSKEPQYTFSEGWTGFEIGAVVRGLRRAYLFQARQQRRQALSDRIKQEVVK